LNLGLTYDLSGKLDLAEQTYLNALEINEKLGRAAPVEPLLRAQRANCYNNLGAIYRTRNQYDRAALYHQKALDLRQELVREGPADPERQAELALSYFNLANSYAALKSSHTQRSYEDGIAIQELLVRTHPSRFDFRIGLARSYAALADVHEAAKQLPEAIKHCEMAKNVWAELAGSRPQDPSPPYEQFMLCTKLCSLHSATGARPAALGQADQACQLMLRLVEQFPDVPAYRQHLALAWRNVGAMHGEAGNWDPSLNAFERAARLFEAPASIASVAGAIGSGGSTSGPAPLLAVFVLSPPCAQAMADAIPKDFERAMYLARVYLDLILACYRSGRDEELVRRGGPLLRSLVRLRQLFPEQQELAGLSRRAHHLRALTLSKLCQYRPALADFDEALKTASGSEHTTISFGRLFAVVCIGDHAGTMEGVDQLAKLPTLTGGQLMTGVRLLCLAGEAVAEDSRLGPPERSALIDKYSARALELVKRAANTGLFDNPAASARLKDSPEFKLLHPRHDFKLFLNTLPTHQPHEARTSKK
jgi:tetratricopeptide (TPR) repeat protein